MIILKKHTQVLYKFTNEKEKGVSICSYKRNLERYVFGAAAFVMCLEGSRFSEKMREGHSRKRNQLEQRRWGRSGKFKQLQVMELEWSLTLNQRSEKGKLGMNGKDLNVHDPFKLCVCVTVQYVWAHKPSFTLEYNMRGRLLFSCWIMSFFWTWSQLFWNSVDWSPPGSSIYGIMLARILEWVAISFSRGSSWPRDWT